MFHRDNKAKMKLEESKRYKTRLVPFRKAERKKKEQLEITTMFNLHENV